MNWNPLIGLIIITTTLAGCGDPAVAPPVNTGDAGISPTRGVGASTEEGGAHLYHNARGAQSTSEEHRGCGTLQPIEGGRWRKLPDIWEQARLTVHVCNGNVRGICQPGERAWAFIVNRQPTLVRVVVSVHEDLWNTPFDIYANLFRSPEHINFRQNVLPRDEITEGVASSVTTFSIGERVYAMFGFQHDECESFTYLPRHPGQSLREILIFIGSNELGQPSAASAYQLPHLPGPLMVTPENATTPELIVYSELQGVQFGEILQVVDIQVYTPRNQPDNRPVSIQADTSNWIPID